MSGSDAGRLGDLMRRHLIQHMGTCGAQLRPRRSAQTHPDPRRRQYVVRRREDGRQGARRFDTPAEAEVFERGRAGSPPVRATQNDGGAAQDSASRAGGQTVVNADAARIVRVPARLLPEETQRRVVRQLVARRGQSAHGSMSSIPRSVKWRVLRVAS